MLVRVGPLPESPLDAAGRFHAEVLPQIRDVAATSDHVTVAFGPADHTHRSWRLAAVQGLAREFAPVRINAIAAQGEAAILAAESYLARSPGVTGQYLILDADGAGDPLS